MTKKLLLFIFFLIFFQNIHAQNEFITIWKPSLTSSISLIVSAPYPANQNQIWFPGIGTDYTIEWEEAGYPAHHGTMNNITSTKQVFIDFGLPLNPHPNQATYRVKVYDYNNSFRMLSSEFTPSTGWIYNGSNDKLIEISQWGTIKWATMNHAFAGCFNLQLTASDSPDLSNVTDMSGMFTNTINFTSNSSINEWNTSSVKNMSGLFSSSKFNTSIDHWDTSNVTDMSKMFWSAKYFNQTLNTWDVSKVANMERMFMLAEMFNQPLEKWNTGSVNNISEIFNQARVFNQPINTWNISNVTNLDGVFAGAASFNQPLNNWNTSNVTSMTRTFLMASAFNQNINNWNTSKVSNMAYMFAEANKYNQPLYLWDTSSVTDMSYMFHFLPSFDQDISSWKTGKVANMEHMLHDCSAFSHTLENWDVGSVSNMDLMLKETTSFNYTLDKWNLKSLTTANQMITYSGIDCVNYSKTLMGWANNNDTPDHINLGSVSDLIYSNIAAVSRNKLINLKGWNIAGDSLGNCESQLGTLEYAFNKEYEVYPNPATDVIYLKSKSDIKSYSIIDMDGKVIVKDHFKENIPVKFLIPGHYILQFISKDKVQTLQFIKE